MTRNTLGDWIATGVEGEHWAIADEVFKKTYEPLPVIPKFIAEYLENFKDSTSLAMALTEPYADWPAYPKASEWFYQDEAHEEIFARAWLDGYQIEEEIPRGEHH